MEMYLDGDKQIDFDDLMVEVGGDNVDDFNTSSQNRQILQEALKALEEKGFLQNEANG